MTLYLDQKQNNYLTKDDQTLIEMKRMSSGLWLMMAQVSTVV